MIIIAYIAMLLFDLSVISGAAYLIVWQGRSRWWMVLAIFLISQSGFVRKDKNLLGVK
jgi:hypothetical protein